MPTAACSRRIWVSLTCACRVGSSALMLCRQLFLDRCSMIPHAPASKPMQEIILCQLLDSE